MKKITFLILQNARLNFLNSKNSVHEFVVRRLNYFGVFDIHFIDNKDVIQAKLRELASDDGFLVVMDIMNPITDFDLVKKMIENLEDSKADFVTSDGAIPGTQVEYILAPGISKIPDTTLASVMVRDFSQNKYNNQFNLYKYKRLKMFLLLVDCVENMHQLRIKEFITELESDAIFNQLAAFGEEAKMHFYKNCPHCDGKITPLSMEMSQPFCGYLPTSRPLYHECQSCGLVVISPYIDKDNTHLIYDHFDKQDFVVSHNNPYHKDAPRCNFSDFISVLPKEVRSLDLGGGIGNFSRFLRKNHESWDVTHSDFAIKTDPELNKIGIRTRALNFLEEEIGDNSYDFISAWEVLEHIPYEKFEFSLRNIHKALSKNGIFAFSTPDFDSPLCKHNDFFAICPPFHYLVFGKKWIEKFFRNSEEWSLVSIRSCSDFLDDASMWYDYASKTAPSFQLRATASIIGTLLEKPENKKLLLEKGFGTEMICVLQKK